MTARRFNSPWYEAAINLLPDGFRAAVAIAVRTTGSSTIACLCAALFMNLPAHAASMSTSTGDGSAFIAIAGEIVIGDAERFQKILGSATGSTFVILNSEGGNVMAALQIGEAIRASGYATAVMNDSECASACGLIWLAGKARYMGRTGHVGFHAAYVGSGDAARETGAANALVGAYLAKLGLSYEAVLFATSAAPNEMRWLHPDNAKKIGVQVVTIAEPEAAPLPVAQTQPAPQELSIGSPLDVVW